MTQDTPPQIRRLLDLLDLSPLGSAQVSISPLAEPGRRDPDSTGSAPAVLTEDITVFIGPSEKMPHNRVFGGQVLAQALMAAGLTVRPTPGRPDRHPHSLHAYFMRPGDDTQPIHFTVEKMRDGRSFSTRRVHALQHQKPILSMSASFQEPAGGVEHQDEMPEVPGPDGLQSLADRYRGIDNPSARHVSEGRAIEHRHVEPDTYVTPAADQVARQHVWLRAIGALPDDPLLHAAVLAYASDYTLLQTILRRHGKANIDPTLRMASLDHAMWFHRPARVDEWILFSQDSPSAQGGRGLGLGRMFTEDGRLIATVAQEGMVRFKDS